MEASTRGHATHRTPVDAEGERPVDVVLFRSNKRTTYACHPILSQPRKEKLPQRIEEKITRKKHTKKAQSSALDILRAERCTDSVLAECALLS